MPSKKKKYNARFPPARIKKIMQIDEDVGKVAAAVPVIISRTLELFVESLLNKANSVTSLRSAKTLTPSHIKACINSEPRFDFLKDLVSAVPDLQGEVDEPQISPVSDSNSFIKPDSSRISIPCPPRDVAAVKKRGRPKKSCDEPQKKKPKKEIDGQTTTKRGPKKRQKSHLYVDDEEEGSLQIDEGAVSSDAESEENESSNGSEKLVTNTSWTTSHLPKQASNAIDLNRTPLMRSSSYTPHSSIHQHSQQVVSSNGIKFSLSYPMPLSPALPPLPTMKSYFGPSTTNGAGGSNTPDLSTVKQTTAISWNLPSGVDEDYDA